MNNINEKIIKLTKDLGLQIKNLELYKLAFTHQSYANENHVENNERLEFLGDAILDFLVAEYLYKKYPVHPEGQLTKIRAKHVCTPANSQYALLLKLEDIILLGKGEKDQWETNSKPAVLADLFEAFLGAIYLDLGMNQVRSVLEKYVFPNIGEEGFFIDYKSKLQEYFQAETRETVKYLDQEESGEPHNKTFKVSVYFDGAKLGTGIGKTKKDASQSAAKNALEKLAIK